MDTADGRRYIGVQIKSEAEADKPDLLKTLKAGLHDARQRYGGMGPAYPNLTDYYIFLAWNARRQANRVRTVTAAFATDPGVRIVPPIHAWAFFAGGSKTQLDAIVTMSAIDEDPLLSKARQMTTTLRHGELSTLLVILTAWMTNPALPVSERFIEASGFRKTIADATAIVNAYDFPHPEAWMRLPLPMNKYEVTSLDQLAVDLAGIDDLIELTGDGVIFSPSNFEPVVALAYEATARYGHAGELLASYMYDLLTTTGTLDETDIVLALAQMIRRSHTPDEEEISVMSQLLILNCPQLVGELTDTQLETLAKKALKTER